LPVELSDKEYPYYGDKNWYYHEAGYQCFTSTVIIDNVKFLPSAVRASGEVID